jgi:hypothetical protein
MPYVAAAIAIVGAIQASKGAKAQAKGQATAAQYNADILERNAEVAEIQAAQTKLIGDIEARERERQFDELVGGVRVAYAASGVDPSSGSARLVAEEWARRFDDEQAAQQMNVETQSAAMREKGVNARLEGALQKIYKHNYIVAGKYRSDAALLQGAGQAASMMGGAA